MLTAQEDASAELDDGPLLKRAAELGRILVTQDDDLLREGARLLHEHREFCGIVYAHQLRVTIGGMVEDLDLIAKSNGSGRMAGKDRIPADPLKSRRPKHPPYCSRQLKNRAPAWSNNSYTFLAAHGQPHILM